MADIGARPVQRAEHLRFRLGHPGHRDDKADPRCQAQHNDDCLVCPAAQLPTGSYLPIGEPARAGTLSLRLVAVSPANARVAGPRPTRRKRMYIGIGTVVLIVIIVIIVLALRR